MHILLIYPQGESMLCKSAMLIWNTAVENINQALYGSTITTLAPSSYCLCGLGQNNSSTMAVSKLCIDTMYSAPCL